MTSSVLHLCQYILLYQPIFIRFEKKNIVQIIALFAIEFLTKFFCVNSIKKKQFINIAKLNTNIDARENTDSKKKTITGALI